MTINLIHLLLGFLIFFLIAYGARLVIRHLAAPPPVETIVMLVLLVLFIVWLVGEFGLSGPVIRIGEIGLYTAISAWSEAMSVKIIHGDCRAILPTLPAESVQCVVTSPPYFGLRSYLPDGHPDKALEIGLKQSPQEYVDELVAVFREVRRVLRRSGVVFLNLGDSYATDTKGSGGKMAKQVRNAGAFFSPRKFTHDLKPKDLMMIPARVALALQADGWWLRSDIIWHKPNPMPESCSDRPTSAYEHVFLLTKAERYFYDAGAIAEPLQTDPKENYPARAKITGRGSQSYTTAHNGSPSQDKSGGFPPRDDVTRNARNVWTITTCPYPEAHFATFPPELAERCIKAGTSEKGCCPGCGAPWARVVERESRPNCTGTGQKHNGTYYRYNPGGGVSNDRRNATTTGWAPSCVCPAHDPIPCTILDPFAGAGTSLVVASRLQRNSIGIELNAEYVELINRRLYDDAPLFAETIHQPVAPSSYVMADIGQLDLMTGLVPRPSQTRDAVRVASRPDERHAHWSPEEIRARGFDPASGARLNPLAGGGIDGVSRSEPSLGRAGAAGSPPAPLSASARSYLKPEQLLQVQVIEQLRPRLVAGAKLIAINGELPGGSGCSGCGRPCARQWAMRPERLT